MNFRLRMRRPMHARRTKPRDARYAGLECANSSKPVAVSDPLIMRPAGPFVAWAALYGLACAHPACADSLTLRMSPDIDVLVPRPASAGRPTSPGSLRAPTTPGAPRAPFGDTETRGALFLRADRLDGTTGRVTAAGNVELRTRIISAR